ncbi:MFS transporter [Rhodococcus kronopolitis]|uniref:MFS transporter n=1 Tax=Rhodococcus kronopolitis TaxID=1460226 RepID=A0ABV9FTP9_9NOCA
MTDHRDEATTTAPTNPRRPAASSSANIRYTQGRHCCRVDQPLIAAPATSAVMISSSYLGSIFFQDVRAMSPLLAGLSLLPMGLASLVVAVALPKIIATQGPARVYLGGVAAQLIGAAAFASGIDNTAVAIALLALIGAGLPSAFVPFYGIGASHVAIEDSGVGSGLLNTFNQTGGAVGIAVVGTTIATVIRNHHDTAAAATLDGVSAGFLAVAICAAGGLIIALVLCRLLSPTKE